MHASVSIRIEIPIEITFYEPIAIIIFMYCKSHNLAINIILMYESWINCIDRKVLQKF